MADQIGLHSARNGAAMAMFLAEFQFSKSCGQVMLFFINQSEMNYQRKFLYHSIMGYRSN